LPPLWTVGTYGGSVRAALLAYKERGRLDLCAPLAWALATAVRAALPWPVPGASPGRAGAPRGLRVALVPVPSRRRAARQRGGDHVLRLAAMVGKLFGGAAVVCPVLRPVGRMPDAAGLTAARRLASRAGSLATSRAHLRWLVTGPQPPPVVVLLDDLVTTGATLATAAAVLRRHDVGVTTAAVVAATERNH
jgi:predicted amidophosphoribosyltransferase